MGGGDEKCERILERRLGLCVALWAQGASCGGAPGTLPAVL